MGISPTLICLFIVCYFMFSHHALHILARIYIRCHRKKQHTNGRFYAPFLAHSHQGTLISGTKLLLFFNTHKYFSKKNHKNNNLIYAIAIYMFNNIFLETYSVSIGQKHVSFVVFSVEISAE